MRTGEIMRAAPGNPDPSETCSSIDTGLAIWDSIIKIAMKFHQILLIPLAVILKENNAR